MVKTIDKHQHHKARASKSEELKQIDKTINKKQHHKARASSTRDRKQIEATADSSGTALYKTPGAQLIMNEYKTAISEGTTYSCICCKRMLYRHSVVKINKQKYIREGR